MHTEEEGTCIHEENMEGGEIEEEQKRESKRD